MWWDIVTKLVKYREYVSAACYYYHVAVFIMYNPICRYALDKIYDRLSRVRMFYDRTSLETVAVKLSERDKSPEGGAGFFVVETRKEPDRAGGDFEIMDL